MGGILVRFAAEEAGGARSAAEEAAAQADHPACARGLLADICCDLEQDQDIIREFEYNRQLTAA